MRIHEWLIPFPGFFHIEKQSLYPLCKEMLDGLGLQELARCCGLSDSQVENILQHSHARNNRAVVFSICAALIIHASDIIVSEYPDLIDEIERVKRGGSDESVPGAEFIQSVLGTCISEKVKPSTVVIGRLLREKVESFFSKSPNGKHIISTTLFTCLLPVVGFHVLSRTGHTDVVDSFWLRLNNILHASGHSNYQQLYLFYGFFRGIMPRVVFHDLYTEKPGGILARVPSFTAGLGSPYDSRGWTYVHLDEALEMVIVRLLKSLNVTMLPYLESAGAWLLTVSHARMLIRTVTAASRAYKHVRGNGDADGDVSPLSSYDRSAVQSSTIRQMVNLMRRKGFLSSEHRNCERLRNVLGNSRSDLMNDDVQNLILNIDHHGQKSAELHASAMFPEAFGPISDEDVDRYLNKKRPRSEWTGQRKIPTAGTAMVLQEERNTAQVVKKARNPKAALSERRLALNKLMTSLTLAEHKAIELGDSRGAESARKRWNMLHSARHLLSPYADAYKSLRSTVRHANKSQLLSALNLEFLTDVEEPSTSSVSDATFSSVQRPQTGRRNVSHYYDYCMPRYFSVMIDIMNHVWCRGSDGRRGNTMFDVTVLKMKQVLRPWFSGRRGESLKQVHLHIDDPRNVIKQKGSEQERRDSTREMSDGMKLSAEEELHKAGFLLPISVPWGTLIGSRVSRDAICSLHLLCGAVAGMELAKENQRGVEIYLHGGCFSIPPACIGMNVADLVPEVSARDETCESPRSGEVTLKRRAETAQGKENVSADTAQSNRTILVRNGEVGCNRGGESVQEDKPLRVLRNRVLVVSKAAGLRITDIKLTHGESETRFVAALKSFVLPTIERIRGENAMSTQNMSACVVVSKDTDVTVILSLAECIRNMNVIHVLGESVVDVDALSATLSRRGVSRIMFASSYVLAGCDFSTGTYGVSHVHYLRACVRHATVLQSINDSNENESLQLLTLLAYLERHGFRNLGDN